MRSDKLKDHSLIHTNLLSLPEEEIKEELIACHAAKVERELEREAQAAKRRRIEEIVVEEGLMIPQQTAAERALNDDTLLEDLLEQNQKFSAKIEFGGRIARLIVEHDINEQSLIAEQREALLLFRRQQPQFEIVNVELRQWQQDAMKYFESPTQRQVIWIRGNNGNEGKTWFQNYVQAFYGFHRVCRLDLRIKHENICNVLKKRTLGTIDIFLFNDSRSVSGEESNLYRILEDIKDGQATTSKYDNDNIRFKTPNTVMVFSNHYPDLKKLSKDRWVLLHPNKDGLKDVLNLYKKNCKDAKERANENFNL